MYCSENISKRIRVLSLLATIAVVIIHSNSLENIKTNAFAWWIGNVIAVLQYWAVPFFFIVSGFFFDRSYVMCNISTFHFLKRKVWSLVVPYLFWGAVFGGIVLTPILAFVNMKAGRPMSENTFLDAPSFFFSVDRLIGGFYGAPPNGALWYVRMLLIIFVFSPLIKWIRNQFRGIGLLCIGVLIISFSSGINMNVGNEVESFVFIGIPIRMKIAGIGYFIFGMLISVYSLEKKSIGKFISFSCISAWLVIMFSVLLFKYAGIKIPCFMEMILKYAPLFVVVSLWSIPWEKTNFGAQLIPIRFWIYCMHHPASACISAGLHVVLGHSLFAEGCSMVMVAPLCLVMVAMAAIIVQKRCHMVFSILNGGR